MKVRTDSQRKANANFSSYFLIAKIYTVLHSVLTY